jgi:hypothetical protein
LRVLVILVVAAAAGGQGPSIRGHTVLALYKSSDGQGAADNEIALHLEAALRLMGLAVRYHDVDRGLPGPRELDDARAVVSWFRGPAMADPLAYLAFLRATIDSGRKILVLDNLGAYQDRASGRWLDSGELNQTLVRLGIQYAGDWTDDPSLVALRHVDASVMRREVLDAPGPRLYYRYLAVDRDLTVLVSVERKDRGYGASPVVMTNANGGFALSTYLHRTTVAGPVLALDLGELARRAIFGQARADRVAVLSETQDAQARLAERLLRTAKIPTDLLANPAGLLPGDLARYTVVVLSLGRADAVAADLLAEYLERGGSVVSLGDALPAPLRQRAAAADEATPGAVKGFRFGPGFLPTEGFFLEDRSTAWVAGNLRPPEGAVLYASDWLEETPLLWSLRTAAGGTVLVWNVRGFFREEHAGLLVESVLAARPVSAAVVPALAAVRLDGFPRPLYNTIVVGGRDTDTDLYASRVWPELRDLLARRGIPVNATLLFNYNDRIQAPFLGGELHVADSQVTVALAREIRASGGELGLFGYNHLSLSTERSGPNPRAWGTQADMEEALRTVRAEWSILLGEHAMPRSYAAPYGILSEAGAAALTRAFPELVIAGTLVTAGGLSEEGFSRAPGSGVRLAPATSTGFLYTEQARRLALAGIAGEGIWIHALDADDVLDPAVIGGRSWDEVLSDFDRMLGFVARHYPWLRYVRLPEMAAEIERLEPVRARFELSATVSGGVAYSIEAVPGLTVRLRHPGLRITSVDGGEVLHAYTRADATVLRTGAGRVTVRLARKGSAP